MNYYIYELDLTSVPSIATKKGKLFKHDLERIRSEYLDSFIYSWIGL